MSEKYDFVTLILVLILVIAGTCTIYSATVSLETGTHQYFIKQIIWALVGIILMIIVSVIPIKTIRRSVYAAYGFVIFLLLMVFVLSKGKQGAERWLMFGPINIQPAELAKLATVLAVSKFLSNKYADINKFKY